MDTSQRLSQAVSIIPLIVTILVLYIGGSLGTWFIVEEFYQYSATDEDATTLVDYSDYDYYLNEVVVVDYTDPDRQTPLESTLLYSSDGYEQRATVFYNLGLVLYATMFISLLCSILLIVLDYLWHEIIKRKLLPGVGKNDILAVIFGGYIAVIVFVLFLALYAVSAIPSGMYEDHYGTDKACLYQEDITIIGSVDGCEGKVSGERAILQSIWTIGPAFIIFVIGVLGPSIYLVSAVYQRFEEVVERIETKPELYFDSEGRILFDVNTGEIVASYADDDMDLFYDEEAMTLFDEGTGEILYAPTTEPEPEPEVVSAVVVEAEPVEAEPVVAAVVEDEPVIDAKGEILEAEIVEAELVEDDEDS